jgi:hypothetical protein
MDGTDLKRSTGATQMNRTSTLAAATALALCAFAGTASAAESLPTRARSAR